MRASTRVSLSGLAQQLRRHSGDAYAASQRLLTGVRLLISGAYCMSLTCIPLFPGNLHDPCANGYGFKEWTAVMSVPGDVAALPILHQRHLPCLALDGVNTAIRIDSWRL